MGRPKREYVRVPQATGHKLLARYPDSPDEAARAAEIRGPCQENSRSRLAIGRAATNHELFHATETTQRDRREDVVRYIAPIP